MVVLTLILEKQAGGDLLGPGRTLYLSSDEKASKGTVELVAAAGRAAAAGIGGEARSTLLVAGISL